MTQLTLTLKMTTAQVVETSVIVNNNSPIQDYVHPDDQTQPFEIIGNLSTRRSWYHGRQPEVFYLHDSHCACQDVLELQSRTSKREFSGNLVPRAFPLKIFFKGQALGTRLVLRLRRVSVMQK